MCGGACQWRCSAEPIKLREGEASALTDSAYRTGLAGDCKDKWLARQPPPKREASLPLLFLLFISITPSDIELHPSSALSSSIFTYCDRISRL
jgi:hypothetical protein